MLLRIMFDAAFFFQAILANFVTIWLLWLIWDYSKTSRTSSLYWAAIVMVTIVIGLLLTIRPTERHASAGDAGQREPYSSISHPTP